MWDGSEEELIGRIRGVGPEFLRHSASYDEMKPITRIWRRSGDSETNDRIGKINK